MPALTTEGSGSSPTRLDPEPGYYDLGAIDDDSMFMIFDQTEADYFRRAPESRFCEYIDGVVYIPSPVRWRHQDIIQFLTTLLSIYRVGRPIGKIHTGPAVLRLSAGRCVEPDFWVMSPDAPAPAAPLMVEGAVSLLVEVISLSTRSHDLDLKARIYREHGVEEIWFIHEERKTVHVERAAGGYTRVGVTEGVIESRSIPGFWIDVAWLWGDSSVPVTECLAAVLAGPPRTR